MGLELSLKNPDLDRVISCRGGRRREGKDEESAKRREES